MLLARPCLHPSWRAPVALRARARGRGRSPQPEQRVRVSAGSCGRSWWEWQRTQRPSPLLCGRPILPSKKPHVIGESAPFPFSAHGALPPVFASMRQRCAKQTKKQAQRLCAHRQTPRSSRSTSCCRPRGTRAAPCSPAAGGRGQPEHRIEGALLARGGHRAAASVVRAPALERGVRLERPAARSREHARAAQARRAGRGRRTMSPHSGTCPCPRCQIGLPSCISVVL